MSITTCKGQVFDFQVSIGFSQCNNKDASVAHNFVKVSGAYKLEFVALHVGTLTLQMILKGIDV